MSVYNIEMTQKTNSGYDTLYPKTTDDNALLSQYTQLSFEGSTVADALIELKAQVPDIDTVPIAKPTISVNSTGLVTATSTQQSGYVTSGTVSSEYQIPTVNPATPTITVNSSGLITATTNQTSGFISAGTGSATKQLSTQSAKIWKPSTSDQTIASGTYLTGAQTIQGDANLVPANIKSGTSIFGVTGNAVGDSFVVPYFSLTIKNNTPDYIHVVYPYSSSGVTGGNLYNKDTFDIEHKMIPKGSTSSEIRIPALAYKDIFIALDGNYFANNSWSGKELNITGGTGWITSSVSGNTYMQLRTTTTSTSARTLTVNFS